MDGHAPANPLRRSLPGVDRVKPERNLGAAKPPWRKANEPPAVTGSSHGTAVCGPACTVVWEGRSREASPYPDSGHECYGVTWLKSENAGRLTVPSPYDCPSWPPDTQRFLRRRTAVSHLSAGLEQRSQPIPALETSTYRHVTCNSDSACPLRPLSCRRESRRFDGQSAS